MLTLSLLDRSVSETKQEKPFKKNHLFALLSKGSFLRSLSVQFVSFYPLITEPSSLCKYSLRVWFRQELWSHEPVMV